MIEPEVRINPFVGLRPFEAEEAPLFFGRSEQTSELIQQLYLTRFLAIVGGSGCGKSSLVRAGLIPRLRAGMLVENRDRWVVITMKPGDSPSAKLVEAFVAELPEEQRHAAQEELRIAVASLDTDAVAKIASQFLGDDANLLLLVDQFEEIFRFALHSRRTDREDEAGTFVSFVLELAKQRALPIYVAMTMRSDFLGMCDMFHGLPEAMNRSQYLVPRLTRRQLRQSIEGPVRLMGAEISHPLVDRLLNEAGDRPDQLPVLQHLLMRIWAAWSERAEGPLDLPHYDAVGGMNKALSIHADEALEGMTPRQRLAAERLFQALTETDRDQRQIRRRAYLSDLEKITLQSREEILAVIERFRDDGRSFLVLSKDPTGDDFLIDISHEALIREWGQLREWVSKEATYQTLYRRVAEAAEQGGSLLRGRELRRTLRWWRRTRPTEAWARRYHPGFREAQKFLNRSRRWYRVRQFVFTAFGVTVVSFVGLIAYAFLVAREKARYAEDKAELETTYALGAQVAQDQLRTKLARQKAEDTIRRGRSLALNGQYEDAVALYVDAQALDEAVVVREVRSWKIAMSPEAERHRIMRERLLAEPERLAREGKLAEAVRALEAVEAELENNKESAPSCDAACGGVGSEAWNTLCWYGGLWGDPENLDNACDNAVKKKPAEDVPSLRNSARRSRAIALAQAGELANAKRDLEAFQHWARTGRDEGNSNDEADHAEKGDRDAANRSSAAEGSENQADYEAWLARHDRAALVEEAGDWINALGRGTNPFDAATLKRLRERDSEMTRLEEIAPALEEMAETLRSELTRQEILRELLSSRQRNESVSVQDLETRDRQIQGSVQAQEAILARPCSDRLRDIQREAEFGCVRLAEILLTDSKGFNVCQTGITSDYYQADEAWWTRTVREGRSRFEESSFDQSAETEGVPIFIPIQDPLRSSDILGVAKVVSVPIEKEVRPTDQKILGQWLIRRWLNNLGASHSGRMSIDRMVDASHFEGTLYINPGRDPQSYVEEVIDVTVRGEAIHVDGREIRRGQGSSQHQPGWGIDHFVLALECGDLRGTGNDARRIRADLQFRKVAAQTLEFPELPQTFTSDYNTVTVSQTGAVISIRRPENGAVVSAIDLADLPRQVVPYTGALFAAALVQPAPRRVLQIGFGAGAFNRLFRHLFPDADLVSVEIDQKMVQLAKRYTGFVETPKDRIEIEDGRLFLERNERQWDWLVLDAFGKNSEIPLHLTTVEFFRLASSRLSKHGALTANLHPTNARFGDQVATLRKVFPTVVFFEVQGHGNIIALATNEAVVPDDSGLSLDPGLRAALLKYVDPTKLRRIPAASLKPGNVLDDDSSANHVDLRGKAD